MTAIVTEITSDVCEDCDQITFLCDCCDGCLYAKSLHCNTCGECSCNDDCNN
jgi:hypothetical protein